MFDFTLPFTIDFDMMSGLSNTAISTKRYLSQMKNMFFDDKAYESMLKRKMSWFMNSMSLMHQLRIRTWHLVQALHIPAWLAMNIS